MTTLLRKSGGLLGIIAYGVMTLAAFGVVGASLTGLATFAA
jgi:hypothetical protein